MFFNDIKGYCLFRKARRREERASYSEFRDSGVSPFWGAAILAMRAAIRNSSVETSNCMDSESLLREEFAAFSSREPSKVVTLPFSMLRIRSATEEMKD